MHADIRMYILMFASTSFECDAEHSAYEVSHATTYGNKYNTISFRLCSEKN